MMFFPILLLSPLILAATNVITRSDKVFEKSYKTLGHVGYYFEYLGEVPRAPKPEIKSENILPPERLPKFNVDPHLTLEEQNLIMEESRYITTNTTRKLSGTYDIFDKEGNLYLKGERVKYPNGKYRKIYKHLAAVGNFFGDVSDNEPAIKKRLTYRPRFNVFSITGLYAPPGEVISVKISKTDLQHIGELWMSIGPILNNGDANNEWVDGRGFPRMPIIGNLFKIKQDLNPHYEDDEDYTFYIGSFLGGPIYLKNSGDTDYTFSVTISGAVRYQHYILGYTTPEEYEENKKSSAPYFDLEIWQNGIMHSGPKSYTNGIDYKDCYDAAIYWQKVTSVSAQVPPSHPAEVSVNMMYEPFIAAGAAVAFGSRASTNCPLSWLTYVLSYKDCLQDSSCDTWGPHHEYHHHFQSNWGMANSGYGDGETSNNAVTLISYSLFSKVSQRRSETSEPTGDSWNLYTSPSWVLSEAIKESKGDYHLYPFALFLHCFGQEMFLKALNQENENNLDKWCTAWADLTGLDFTYFYTDIYNSANFIVSQEEIDKYKNGNYKKFVPIACRYQTGVGYKIKGKYNKVRTLYPFLIKKGENKVLNFSKQMVVPSGFTYRIKSATNPAHGKLTKQSDNVYVYTPDDNSKTSGEITFTIGLTKDGDSNFAIDDIEMYVELETTQSLVDKDNHGRDILDRTIYTYPYIPNDPIAEYNSGFANATSEITILNNATNGGLNTQIMVGSGINPQNRISVLQGKFEVQKGKYRIALMCRNLGVLYLSYDGGKTYELGCRVLFECADERYYPDHEEIFVHKEFAAPQWVYFKFVVCHKMQNTGRRLFSKIGLDKYNENGEVSSTITDLTNARSIRYFPDPVFYSKDFYPKVWSQSRTTRYTQKGSLLAYNYVKYPDPKFEIDNLFDDDNSNIIHTNNNFVTDTNPFMIFVDLGEVIETNTMTIYGANEGQWQYQPLNFKLYAGVNKDDLKLIYQVEDASVVNKNIKASFDMTSLRYYQLNVTRGRGSGNFVAFRYIEFSSNYKGTLVSLDDDRVTLYNDWKKVVSRGSTFGNIFESEGNSAKVSFTFRGTGFGINSVYSPKYGAFKVYVDGELKEEVNLNDDFKEYKPCVYKVTNLADREHEVVLSGSSKFNVDSFIIIQDDLQSTNEEFPIPLPPTPTPPPPIEIPTQSSTPNATPEDGIEPTALPVIPIETPEPLETEVVKPINNGVIDTTSIPSESNNKEYKSEVSTSDLQIIGKGNDNLYIYITNKNKIVDISQTGATFGVKLDKLNNEASIRLNQNNIHMNVKGSGTLTIDAHSTIKDLTFNDIIVSHEEALNLITDAKLESVAFENLKMFGSSAFNFNNEKAAQAKVKAMTVYEGAESQISNLNVTDAVDIALNAAVSLTNVDLADLPQMNISFSRSPQHRTPITGKLGKPPISISLVESESVVKASLLEDNAFTIASTPKDDFPDCQSWVKAVDIEETAFSKVECRTKDENRELVAYYKEGKGKGSNKTGLIVGVVIAVIVVIAIVVVVVVIVLKKKRAQHSSDQSILNTTVI